MRMSIELDSWRTIDDAESVPPSESADASLVIPAVIGVVGGAGFAIGAGILSSAIGRAVRSFNEQADEIKPLIREAVEQLTRIANVLQELSRQTAQIIDLLQKIYEALEKQTVAIEAKYVTRLAAAESVLRSNMDYLNDHRSPDDIRFGRQLLGALHEAATEFITYCTSFSDRNLLLPGFMPLAQAIECEIIAMRVLSFGEAGIRRRIATYQAFISEQLNPQSTRSLQYACDLLDGQIKSWELDLEPFERSTKDNPHVQTTDYHFWTTPTPFHAPVPMSQKITRRIWWDEHNGLPSVFGDLQFEAARQRDFVGDDYSQSQVHERARADLQEALRCIVTWYWNLREFAPKAKDLREGYLKGFEELNKSLTL